MVRTERGENARFGDFDTGRDEEVVDLMAGVPRRPGRLSEYSPKRRQGDADDRSPRVHVTDEHGRGSAPDGARKRPHLHDRAMGEMTEVDADDPQCSGTLADLERNSRSARRISDEFRKGDGPMDGRDTAENGE